MGSVLHQPLLYWATAALVVLGLSMRACARQDLDPWTMYLAGVAGLLGAWAGGTLYAHLILADESAHHSIGAGAIGAFAGAGLAFATVVRGRGAGTVAFVEAALPAVALGYAIYRIGCLVNGCCFGAPTSVPWGITVHPGQEAFAAALAGQSAVPASLTVHPTQIYHAAVGLGGYLLLRQVGTRRCGFRLAIALALYGGARFLIQYFRGDRQAFLGSLDMNQWFSLGMLALAACWYYVERNRALPIPFWRDTSARES